MKNLATSLSINNKLNSTYYGDENISVHESEKNKDIFFVLVNAIVTFRKKASMQKIVHSRFKYFIVIMGWRLPRQRG